VEPDVLAMTTLGKYRHLSRCSTPAGHFVILAIDHRDNLRASLNQHAPQPLTDDDFRAFKGEVIGALINDATALLTDPEYGIGPAVAGRVLGGGQGLLAPLEVTNYDVHPAQRAVNFIPDWGVTQIKRIGGDGVKLLLYYHPDADTAETQRGIVRRIVDECGTHDIPFFLEPIPYALDPAATLSSDELRQVTVTMARTFSAMGVDVLKLQFPSHTLLHEYEDPQEEMWFAACAEVTAASSVPWALLSGGVDFHTFALQTRIACAAGASGVIVGRAVWDAAVTSSGVERTRYLTTNARNRMQTLGELVAAHGAAWWAKTEAPDVGGKSRG